MVDIEDIKAILIREKYESIRAKYPPKKNLKDEFNELALKHNWPDLVRKPYLKNKPLTLTMWKKLYITPQLELKNDLIMESHLKRALIAYIAITLYPFIVILFLTSL